MRELTIFDVVSSILFQSMEGNVDTVSLRQGIKHSRAPVIQYQIQQS